MILAPKPASHLGSSSNQTFTTDTNTRLARPLLQPRVARCAGRFH
jgi:hypothetical protein